MTKFSIIIPLLLMIGCASAPLPAPPPPTSGEAQMVSGPNDGPLWQSPATIAKRCRAAQDRIGTLRDAIKAGGGDALAQHNQLLGVMDHLAGWLELIAAVHPDESTRNGAEECQRALAGLSNDLNLDRGAYDKLVAVDRGPLDPIGVRALEKTLLGFKRAGVDKDEKVRARLKTLYDDMIKVGQDFDRAIREDVQSIEVDPGRLKGLPADFIQAHPVGKSGKVKLDTNYPDFFPVQTYADDASLRKELFVVFASRAASNKDTLQHLLELRYEYATSLGYPDWAAYIAEDKMLKTTDAIEKFIAEVAKISRPRMDKDLKEVLARKKKDEPKAKTVEAWDRFYYVEKVRKEKYGFDASSVRPYFEFQRVTDGLFDVYGQLFGVRFVKDEQAPRWHPSVQVYDLYEGDKKLGSFYLDMFPRPNKYGHAGMFPLQTGLADGTPALAALVCNFPDPSSGNGPALMDYDEVKTYFHEFGHLIHQLLATDTNWLALGGIAVEADFVEAPSQLLEEWVLDAGVLQRFAKHIETNEPIPAATVQKLRASTEFGQGMHLMRQIFYTALSFELHHKKPDGLDLDAVASAIEKRYSPYPQVPGTRLYASFGHLQGYSSMYYTYQWSLVLAKDIFTRFAKAGLLDPATAEAYRSSILKPGGTKDASDLVASFLGRPSNLDAYRAWLEAK